MPATSRPEARHGDDRSRCAGRDPETGNAGVDLHVHRKTMRRESRDVGLVEQAEHYPPARRRGDLAVGDGTDDEQRQLDAGGSDFERLIQSERGQAQPRNVGGRKSAGNRDKSVAVGIRFDHRTERGRGSSGRKRSCVRYYGVEVDLKPRAH